HFGPAALAPSPDPGPYFSPRIVETWSMPLLASPTRRLRIAVLLGSLLMLLAVGGGPLSAVATAAPAPPAREPPLPRAGNAAPRPGGGHRGAGPALPAGT